jgi:hypothetical protein
MTSPEERTTPTPSPGSPWPWLLAAGLAFLVLVGTIAGSFIYATRAVTGSTVELEIDGTTCRTQAEWTANPTIFLRDQTVPAGTAMLGLAPYGPDGHVILMSPKAGTSIDIPKGAYHSIATIDLTAFDPTDEICFDVGGLEDQLTTGDLLVVGDFASPLVAAFLSSCGVGAVMVVVIGVSIIKAKNRFDAA